MIEVIAVEAPDFEAEIAALAARAHSDPRAVGELAALALKHARAHERAQALTITDEHTGLYNARHLRHVLAAEVARSFRFRHTFSLVFLDLDRFKSINDQHGHRAGSKVLAELGERLLSSIRRIDLAFRYGGDEFVLLLLETDRAGAGIVAERVRNHLEEKKFLEGRATVTASFGIASFPDDATSAEMLLERADAAMYRAKSSGRNCVRRHSV